MIMADGFEKLSKELIEICHRLYARGFVTATDGKEDNRGVWFGTV